MPTQRAEKIRQASVLGAGLGALLAILWLIPAHTTDHHTRDPNDGELWHSHTTVQFGLLGHLELDAITVTRGSRAPALPRLWGAEAKRSWRFDPVALAWSSLLTVAGLVLLRMTEIVLVRHPRGAP